MNRYILFIALMASLLPAISQKAVFGGISTDEQNSDVSMTITKFQVNDQTLELGWKIVNSSDHDVWVCDGLTTGYYFDWFLDNDDETLMIIKRSSLPQGQGWEHWPWVRFIRLRPGQDKEDSISLAVPVRPNTKFSHPLGNAEYARRVAIGIGFYDEDLRGLILDIVDLTEQLSCDTSLLSSIVTPDAQIPERFFAGVYIAQVFHDKSFGGFRNDVLSNGDEISMPYMNQVLNGEQVLRATIDSVSIPYKSNYPPLTDEPSQSQTEPAGVTTILTKLDVNDTNLKMDFKIINNTDHDLWLCDNYVDVFMETDNKILVIRTRYNLSNEGIIWEFPFPRFRYSRLRPGNEKIESISLSFPVKPHALFKTSRGNAEYAKRLAIEIGYYDEDLRKLILNIVEMAEKLNCDGSAISPWEPNSTLELYYRFFGGIEIAGFFNSEGSTYFSDSVMSDSDEIIAPYLKQTLHGEKVLRIEIDNVSIPYESNYPPLND